MNRIFLITAVLLFFAGASTAQRFTGGALLGLNGSQVEGDGYKGYSKPGLAAGFYVETDISAMVFAGMELKYNEKGVRKNPDAKDINKYILRLNYIDMPVYAAVRTNEWGALLAGIQPGYLLSSKELNAYGELPPEDQSEFKKFDLQAILGFQFQILDRLKTDLRFALSVVKVADKSGESGYYVHEGLFNNVISVTAFYQIGSR